MSNKGAACMNWGVAACLNVILQWSVCSMASFITNKSILSIRITHPSGRGLLLSFWWSYSVHNEERLQRKGRTVEMWVKVLHNGTAFYNKPCMYTTTKTVLSLKTVLKHRCRIFFWMGYMLGTIYGKLVVNDILYHHIFKLIKRKGLSLPYFLFMLHLFIRLYLTSFFQLMSFQYILYLTSYNIS